MVILKRPAVKEAGNDFEHHHIYPIDALTQSRKLVPAKVSRPQDFCPTSQLTKPAVRKIEHSLAQPESRNLEWLNEKITRCPSFSSPLLEYDDIEDNARDNGDSYEISSTLSISQEIYAQFKGKDDILCDIAKSIR